MQLRFFDDDEYRMLSGKQPEEEENGHGCGETMPQVFFLFFCFFFFFVALARGNSVSFRFLAERASTDRNDE